MEQKGMFVGMNAIAGNGFKVKLEKGGRLWK
jgi:hypothetical protein